MRSYLLPVFVLLVHLTYSQLSAAQSDFDDNWVCVPTFHNCGGASGFLTQVEAIQAGHEGVASVISGAESCGLMDPQDSYLSSTSTNHDRYGWFVYPIPDNTPACGYDQWPDWNIQLTEYRCDAGYYWHNQSTYWHKCLVIPSCSTGQSFNEDTQQCEGPIDPHKTQGPSPEGCGGYGNPVNPATGNKFQVETDYVSPVPGGLKFRRHYNSRPEVLVNALGKGWRYDYWQRITTTSLSYRIRVLRPDGKDIFFLKENNEWSTDADFPWKLVEVLDGSGNHTGFVLTLDNGTIEEYVRDTTNTNMFKLVKITDRNGLSTILDYDLLVANGGNGDTRHADLIIDPFGRTIHLLYDSNLKLIGFEDPDGNEYQYQRDTNDNLTEVIYPDNTPLNSSDNPRRIYHYEETAFPNSLTGITDENGVRFSTYDYDSQNRAILTEHAGGAGSFSFTYNTNGTTTVTDAGGAVQTLSFAILHEQPRLNGVSGDKSGYCPNQFTSASYDTNGFVSSRTDYNGNVTNFAHNSDGLETSRTEGYGSADARTINTTWHSTFRVPTEIEESGKDTTFTYDSAGRLLTRTETDTATSSSRTTTYTYYGPSESSPGGLLKTIDGPRTDVSDITTYDYDSSGNVTLITNPLGHETEFTSYDAHGRPLTMIDPNNTTTTFTYDKRGRLLTRTTDSKTTTFEYDDVGNITKTTLPNSAFLINEYDNAHRLTAVEDNFSNRIEYTLDDNGNRTAEDVKDPLNTLTRALDRTYNSLNHLTQVTGGAGQVVAYTYDNNGNQTGITVDPTGLNQATTQAFDALNRMVSSTDSDLEVTYFDYDGRDNLIEVTDPESLVTSYTYDGLDNLKEVDSPDTGITTYAYDAAGNSLSQTDARSVTTSYSYDALNRLTGITYTDTNQNVDFTYDTCTNGVGRLCEMADESGTTTYTYDASGNLVSEGTTRGTISKTVSYAYDNADQVVQIIYPSGRIVDIERDANGQIEEVSTTMGMSTTILADNITYQPFGPVDSLDFGNGLSESRIYDLDYRVTDITAADSSTYLDYDYTYDDANNITQITNYLDANRTQVFDYDDLNRLIDASGIYGDLDYTYDANGNRLTEVRNSSTDTYSYYSATHRLSQVTNGGTQSFSYDNAGNTTSNTNYDFVYGDNNRLAEVEISSTPVADYIYNGRGERVKKTATSTVLYYYDQNGQLIAELDSSGNTVREYVYLYGQPLALITSGSIYYYHNDHLGTPQILTDGSKFIVWQGDYEPFGNVNITTGSVVNNLGFPGQYYDQETGLHYNYFRDYDPAIGRYLQSDPIGLDGGMNTYSYVENNPIQWIDPLGLAKGGKKNIGTEGFNRHSDPKAVEEALKDAIKKRQKGRAAALRALLKVIKRGGTMSLVPFDLSIPFREACSRGDIMACKALCVFFPETEECEVFDQCPPEA